MPGTLKTILLSGCALGLVACTSSEITSSGQPFDTRSGEAGAFLDEGGFGEPTLNNQLVQTGERNFIIDLNKRFSQEVPTMVTFAFDSAVIDGAARATLDQQAAWIKRFPQVRFKVFGHTDLVGSETYNKALGLRRARAVVNYLVRHGISRSRLEAVVSFGETQPLIVTEGREQRNRRTVTEVSGLIQPEGTPLNGKFAREIFRGYVPSAAEVQSDGGVTGGAAPG